MKIASVTEMITIDLLNSVAWLNVHLKRSNSCPTHVAYAILDTESPGLVLRSGQESLEGNLSIAAVNQSRTRNLELWP